MTRRQWLAAVNLVVLVIVLMGGGAWLQNNLHVTVPPGFLLQQPSLLVPTPTSQVLAAVIEPAEVVRVIDGDTIELKTGQKVRYIGIDTPETVHPQKALQCYGKAASQKNTELVANKTVYLVKDISETDRYGRLLRYVYLSPEASMSGMVNARLVAEGFAKASSYPPDVKYQKDFQVLETVARLDNKGLWSVECQAP